LPVPPPWCAPLRPGLVVGLAAEARIAARLGPVLAGGGQPEGAEAAAERLVAAGATALISFGLCGGLDPALRPGDLVVPDTIMTDNDRYDTDTRLAGHLGTPAGTLYAAGTAVAHPDGKAALFARTRAVAVDLESGAVARVAARHGLPFAVLRAVCDPANLGLPPAALVALDAHGAVAPLRVVASLLARPGQLGTLLRLARAATKARAALIRRVSDILRP
jgi:adenosylhomocysteine nucleosidase